ncbi:MAG: ornithine cyclodeaminase family protein, partial [Alphaproteobacteria bacterium]|nr:ornithine cyclodeaminase family protein [Alphaproteobacteria bacterium]
MLVLTAADVERLLDIPACIPAMRSAMAQVSDGRALMPLRQFMAVPGAPGKLGLMPGWLAEPPRFGVKIVSKYVRPPGDPHGTHVGGVMLFDAATGLALALIEGGSLTAIRTAAASALATDLLARPGPAVVAVLGAGEQARRHVEAMRAVRLVSEVRVWARDPARAAAFAAEVGGEA